MLQVRNEIAASFRKAFKSVNDSKLHRLLSGGARNAVETSMIPQRLGRPISDDEKNAIAAKFLLDYVSACVLTEMKKMHEQGAAVFNTNIRLVASISANASHSLRECWNQIATAVGAPRPRAMTDWSVGGSASPPLPTALAQSRQSQLSESGSKSPLKDSTKQSDV